HHRARHGPDRRAVRSGRGDGRGARPHRRQLRRGAAQPPRAGGVSRRHHRAGGGRGVSLLEVRDVYGGYGAADILNGVDLTLDEGQIVVIIGPNGAGKSTLMKAVFGLVRVRSGTIRFAGEDITNVRPDQLVPKGMSYVPQERNVFPSLTVQENLEMGAYLRDDDYSADLEQVFQIFPVLEERRRQPAG